jgi:hypothetical protein
MEIWFDETDTALQELERFMATKIKRGYRAVAAG